MLLTWFDVIPAHRNCITALLDWRIEVSLKNTLNVATTDELKAMEDE